MAGRSGGENKMGERGKRGTKREKEEMKLDAGATLPVEPAGHVLSGFC